MFPSKGACPVRKSDLRFFAGVLGTVACVLFVASEATKDPRERLILSKDSKLMSALSDGLKVAAVVV